MSNKAPEHVPQTESDFSFPYNAYKIQLEFMQSMYKVINERNIGIFESPTGTGKSLSIICGSLTWLMNHSNNEQVVEHEHIGNAEKRGRECHSSNSDGDEPAWIKEQEKQIKEEREKNKLIKEKEKEENRKNRVEAYQKKRAKFLRSALELPKKDSKNGKNKEEDDFDLLLKDYDDSIENSSSFLNSLNIGIKSSLLDDLFSSDEEEELATKKKRRINSIFVEEIDDESTEMYYTPKIIYCSRTHTQLNQFIREIKKTKFVGKVRLVSLASRNQMCIHPVVSKIQSQSRVNELCLDMKSKKEKTQKCPYDDQSGQLLFKDHVLINIKDIEDLTALGKKLDTCPYYGSRKAVPQAQIVILPYSSLINQQTRESLGIKLENCVVIIDEAHNLVDAVIKNHSCQINQAQIQQCHEMLSSYFTKYKARLKPSNQHRVSQLLNIMSSILNFFKNGVQGSVQVNENSIDQLVSEVLNLNDFSLRINVHNINMFEICEFMNKSELTKKLHGFMDRINKEKVKIHKKEGEYEESIEFGIYMFHSFLLTLTNISKDGKILIQINKTNPCKSFIKFLLLNPSIYFKEIVEKPRSIILAGGTMEPISSIIQQLFPSQMSRVEKFQFGHVIPDENILPICLSTAPSSNPFEFTFLMRSRPSTMNDLGNLIINLCNVVPDGIVVFFPSYAYESTVYDYWLKNSIIRRIETKKKFFREPKKATEVESVLSEYKETIDRSALKKDNHFGFKGALLSCVIGGKMSEGINFSDQYGRLVVVVGLPYPNLNDLELKEKMNYLNSIQKESGTDYYDDMCMKAVNQSIGRSIRHIKDYASILLLDKRYCRPKIQSRLPNWIRSRLQAYEEFGPAFAHISRFFRAKTQNA